MSAADRIAAADAIDQISDDLTTWAGLWLDGADESQRKDAQDLADAVAVGRTRLRLSQAPEGRRQRPVKPSLSWAWVKANVGKGPVLDGVKRSLPKFDKAFAIASASPTKSTLAAAAKALALVQGDLEAAASTSRKPTKRATYDATAMAETADSLVALCESHAAVLSTLTAQVATFDPKAAATAATKALTDASVARAAELESAHVGGIEQARAAFDKDMATFDDRLDRKKRAYQTTYEKEKAAAEGDTALLEKALAKLRRMLVAADAKYEEDRAYVHNRRDTAIAALTENLQRQRAIEAFTWAACKPVLTKGSSLYKSLTKPFPAFDRAKAKFVADPSAKTVQAALDALFALQKGFDKASAAKDEKTFRQVLHELDQRARAEATALQAAESELPRARMATAMMRIDGGAEVLDSQVASLGGAAKGADDKAMVRAALKARYGLESLEGDMTTKALPRLYDVLGRVPTSDTGANDSLKMVVRDRSGFVPNGYYDGDDDEKKVHLAVGRTGRSGLTKALFGVTLPYVERPPGGWEGSGLDKPKSSEIFDHLTLHEVGHAVDDKLGFMDRRMDNRAYGAWRDSSREEVIAIAGDDLGFFAAFATHDTAALRSYLEVIVAGKDPRKDDALREKFGDTPPKWRSLAAHEGVKFLQSARLQPGSVAEVTQWDTKAKKARRDDRVYQEAYEDTWYSYDVSVRSRGLGGYQFRAPGEWFSEIYANYFGRRLSNSHPDYAWMEALVDTEQR